MSEDVRKENPKLQGNGWVSKQKRKQKTETSIHFAKTEGAGKKYQLFKHRL